MALTFELSGPQRVMRLARNEIRAKHGTPLRLRLSKGLGVSTAISRLFPFVAVWLFKELDDLCTLHELRAVHGARGYVVRASGVVDLSRPADRELNRSFEHCAPLTLVAVSGEFNIFQDLEEDELTLLGL